MKPMRRCQVFCLSAWSSSIRSCSHWWTASSAGPVRLLLVGEGGASAPPLRAGCGAGAVRGASGPEPGQVPGAQRLAGACGAAPGAAGGPAASAAGERGQLLGRLLEVPHLLADQRHLLLLHRRQHLHQHHHRLVELVEHVLLQAPNCCTSGTTSRSSIPRRVPPVPRRQRHQRPPAARAENGGTFRRGRPVRDRGELPRPPAGFRATRRRSL